MREHPYHSIEGILPQAEEEDAEAAMAAIDKISSDHMLEILDSPWDKATDFIKLEFLLNNGVIPMYRDTRCLDKKRILNAIIHVTGETMTAAHIADMTGINTKNVSEVLFELETKDIVKELCKGIV